MCVLNKPLRCSPLGFPDIIGHYPCHSSNTAGAREHGCFCRYPPTSCLPTFYCCSFTRLPCGAFRQPNTQEAQRRCKFVHSGGACRCSEQRKGKERTADGISPLPLCCAHCLHPVTKINLCKAPKKSLFHSGSAKRVSTQICNLHFLTSSSVLLNIIQCHALFKCFSNATSIPNKLGRSVKH